MSDWLTRRERGPQPGELSYDYSDSQETSAMPAIVKGSRVRHPRFGTGIVSHVDGRGLDLKAVIDFEIAGRKKVVVRYANLEAEDVDEI